MLEIFRRSAALILICLGGYFIIWPGGKLIIVEHQDFRPGYEAKLQEHQKSKTGNDNGISSSLIAAPGIPSYREYISSKTQGNELNVSGPQWAEITQLLKNPAENPSLREREYGFRRMRYIYSPDEEPFNTISSYPKTALYLFVNNRFWIRVRADYAGDIYGLPEKYLYPFRYYGLGLIILGFALYFIIPRHRFAKDEIHYPRGATVTGPDMLGLIMTPLFFLLPFLIVWEIDSGTSILSISKGWIWLTGAMWLLAAVCLMFMAMAWKFSTLCFKISKDGFSQIQNKKEVLFRWEDIDYFQRYKTTIGSKLSTLLLIFGTTLQAISMGLMLRGQEEHGIKIFDCDGKKIKVMANALNEFDDIVRALKERGIKRKPMGKK